MTKKRHDDRRARRRSRYQRLAVLGFLTLGSNFGCGRDMLRLPAGADGRLQGPAPIPYTAANEGRKADSMTPVALKSVAESYGSTADELFLASYRDPKKFGPDLLAKSSSSRPSHGVAGPGSESSSLLASNRSSQALPSDRRDAENPADSAAGEKSLSTASAPASEPTQSPFEQAGIPQPLTPRRAADGQARAAEAPTPDHDVTTATPSRTGLVDSPDLRQASQETGIGLPTPPPARTDGEAAAAAPSEPTGLPAPETPPSQTEPTASVPDDASQATPPAATSPEQPSTMEPAPTLVPTELPGTVPLSDEPPAESTPPTEPTPAAAPVQPPAASTPPTEPPPAATTLPTEPPVELPAATTPPSEAPPAAAPVELPAPRPAEATAEAPSVPPAAATPAPEPPTTIELPNLTPQPMAAPAAADLPALPPTATTPEQPPAAAELPGTPPTGSDSAPVPASEPPTTIELPNLTPQPMAAPAAADLPALPPTAATPTPEPPVEPAANAPAPTPPTAITDEFPPLELPGDPAQVAGGKQPGNAFEEASIPPAPKSAPAEPPAPDMGPAFDDAKIPPPTPMTARPDDASGKGVDPASLPPLQLDPSVLGASYEAPAPPPLPTPPPSVAVTKECPACVMLKKQKESAHWNNGRPKPNILCPKCEAKQPRPGPGSPNRVK